MSGGESHGGLRADLAALLRELPGWKLGNGAGGISLGRGFVFPSHRVAQSFLSAVAGLAATFNYPVDLRLLAREVEVRLFDLRRGVTADHLRFARATSTLFQAFCQAVKEEATLSAPRVPRPAPRLRIVRPRPSLPGPFSRGEP